MDQVRLRVDLGYDGTDFSGWAAQPGRRTVEGELSQAFETILRQRPVRLTTAGRTDAGVHARGAVVHADVPREAWETLPGRSNRTPERAALTRLAGILPGDIVVHRVATAPPGFDARFSAISRRYSYRICDQPERLDPLRRRDTVTLRRRLDEAAMNDACARLIGLHDFAAFCRRREGATTVRTLLRYDWHRSPAAPAAPEDSGGPAGPAASADGADPDGAIGPAEILLATVVADAFCHSMVRALVGAAVAVGEGRRDPAWAAEVLADARRDPGIQVMPAHGLCLEEVTYPPDSELAFRAQQARSRRELPTD